MELSLKHLNFILLLEFSSCVRKEGRKESWVMEEKTTDVPSLQYILICEQWARTSALIPFLSLLYPSNPWCKWCRCEGWPHHRALRPLLFSNSSVGSFSKGWFPVSRNFYVRKIYVCKQNRGNAWKVARKRKSWTSLNFSFKLSTFYLASILSIKVRNLKRVSGNQPYRDNRESVNRLHDNAPDKRHEVFVVSWKHQH